MRHLYRRSSASLRIPSEPKACAHASAGVDLDRPFPFDEIEYNRCALQVSDHTELEEIHSLFSFMRMGQVWITAGGRLLGVVTDSALIECCMAPPS